MSAHDLPASRLALRTGALLALSIAVLIVGCGGDGTATGAAASARTGDDLPVEMHVRWTVDPSFPATMTIHEPPADQQLYETRSYEAGVTAEVGTQITDGVLRAPYGEPRRFTALLRNDSDEDIRFWVAPHLPVPHIGHEGLMMFCLCTGEVYEIPARGSWTRVMEFGVTRRAGLEGPVALTHVIVRGELPTPTPAGAGAASGGAG